MIKRSICYTRPTWSRVEHRRKSCFPSLLLDSSMRNDTRSLRFHFHFYIYRGCPDSGVLNYSPCVIKIDTITLLTYLSGSVEKKKKKKKGKKGGKKGGGRGEKKKKSKKNIDDSW